MTRDAAGLQFRGAAPSTSMLLDRLTVERGCE